MRIAAVRETVRVSEFVDALSGRSFDEERL